MEQAFYIQAVLYDIDFTESGEDMSYRESLENLAEEKGAETLQEMLRKVDPVSAEEIHANNIKRVIRALEYFQQTGEPISFTISGNGREKSRQRLFCSMPPGLFSMSGLTGGWMRCWKMAWWRKWSLRGRAAQELVFHAGTRLKEILAWLDGEISYEKAVEIF